MAKPKKNKEQPAPETPVESLTAAVESVSAEAIESTAVIDKLANVDASFHTSAADLASAVERAAQTTAEAGATIAEVIEKVVSRPAVFERDERGLVKGVEYHYLPDGKVDWRKMIDPQYLVFKDEKRKEIEDTYGKKLEELSPNEVDDKYLLILLGGIKDLLKLRGSHKVSYPNRVAQPEFVSTDCEIVFMGSFETPLGEPEIFTDGADATPDNVDGWYSKFLTTAAINRAFVRAVRNYLGIYITGKDEMGPNGKSNDEGGRKATPTGFDGFGPYAMLADLLKKRERTLDQLKKFLKSKAFDTENSIDLDTINKLEDFPKDKVLRIVGLIKTLT